MPVNIMGAPYAVPVHLASIFYGLCVDNKTKSYTAGVEY